MKKSQHKKTTLGALGVNKKKHRHLSGYMMFFLLQLLVSIEDHKQALTNHAFKLSHGISTFVHTEDNKSLHTIKQNTKNLMRMWPSSKSLKSEHFTSHACNT